MKYHNLQQRTKQFALQMMKVDPVVAAPVLREANELVAIAISSINTAKRDSGDDEHSG